MAQQTQALHAVEGAIRAARAGVASVISNLETLSAHVPASLQEQLSHVLVAMRSLSGVLGRVLRQAQQGTWDEWQAKAADRYLCPHTGLDTVFVVLAACAAYALAASKHDAADDTLRTTNTYISSAIPNMIKVLQVASDPPEDN
jgi:SNF family Na+-dependent transporter